MRIKLQTIQFDNAPVIFCYLIMPDGNEIRGDTINYCPEWLNDFDRYYSLCKQIEYAIHKLLQPYKIQVKIDLCLVCSVLDKYFLTVAMTLPGKEFKGNDMQHYSYLSFKNDGFDILNLEKIINIVLNEILEKDKLNEN